METAQIREELHQFIDRADHRILNLVYGMMKAMMMKGILLQLNRMKNCWMKDWA